jgi:subtilisin-like proprotein convertase family protein
LLSCLLSIAFGIFPCPAPAATIISKDFNDRPIPSFNDPNSEFGMGKMDNAIIDVQERISIHDLDIAVTLTHEAFFDLEIVLVNPDGQAITLNPRSNYAFITTGPDGGNDVIGGTYRLWFNDEAADSINKAMLPFDQPYKPAEDKLSDLENRDAYGLWQLQIMDVWPAHIGRLDKVELIINTPEPGTLCLFGLAAVMARFLKKKGQTPFSGGSNL